MIARYIQFTMQYQDTLAYSNYYILLKFCIKAKENRTLVKVIHLDIRIAFDNVPYLNQFHKVW